jgi:hypothetical protein
MEWALSFVCGNAWQVRREGNCPLSVEWAVTAGYMPELFRKNKAPLTRMSHGTPVKQPSPKCCSRTTLRFCSSSGNGTDGLFPGPKACPEKASHFGRIPLKSRVSRERTGASVTCLITSARAIFSMAIAPRPTAITDLRRGARAKIKEGLNTCCSHRKTRTRYQPRMPIPTPL